MKTNFYLICIVIVTYAFSPIFAQMEEKVSLNEKEMEFLAAKISKVQADFDKLNQLHKTFQNDSLIRPGLRQLLFSYNNLGINCFELDSQEESQTYDIITNRIEIDGVSELDLAIYHSFMSDKGKQYFTAVDHAGHMFLLHNFWIDEFKDLVKKKLGKISDKYKALLVLKIFTAVKLYSVYELWKVIITEDNIGKYKSDYPYLEPAKIFKDKRGNFDCILYTYSPYSGGICLFNFKVSKDGEIEYKVKVVRESSVTD